MRRLLIAAGLIIALVGGLLFLPFARMKLTHETGNAQVLEIYRQPQADGNVALRVVWEVQVAPGQRILGDRQASHYFRPVEDPVMSPEDADAAMARLLPDEQGRRMSVPAFWKANDPAGTAFIIAVNKTHPWRRYIGSLIICLCGLIMVRLAWARRS